MPPADPIARQLLSDALELYRRKLWMRGAQEAPILVRWPGAEHAAVATLVGREGQDFGVSLAIGEEAFVEAVRTQYLDEQPDRDRVRTIVCTIEPLHQIPPDFRGVFAAARLSFRRDALAPWIMVAHGPGPARPARKGELRTLAWGLRALILADDAGELDPPELDLDDRRVLSIEVSGSKPPAARAEARVVPWPQEIPGLEAPPKPVDDPRTLEEWKAAEAAFVGRVARSSLQSGLWSERALSIYFGSEERAATVFEELYGLQPHAAFIEWLVTDYRPKRRSRSWIENLLKRRDGTPAELALARARAESELLMVRVVARDPDGWFEVEDLVGGGTTRIRDAGLASSLPDGVCLPLRLLHVGEWVFPAMAGPPLMAWQVDRALEALSSRGADLANLRKHAELLGLWWQLPTADRRPPVLQNTDGDPLRPLSACFLVSEPGPLARALSSRADVDEGEEPDSWVWLRHDSRSDDLPSTVLGRLELLDDRLLLEVNSNERLARARKWIEALPGGARFESETEHSLDRKDVPLDDQLPGLPPEPLSADRRETLADYLLERQLGWLDESIPALGGKTPRQACRTRQGRLRVAAMIRSMPAVGTPGGPIEPPRERLLSELGLAQ